MNLPGLNKPAVKIALPASLAEAEAGTTVTVDGLDGLSQALRQSLLAYGILPGRPLRVIAHSPLVVVQVEHTELALEMEIARGVKIAFSD